MRISWTEQSDAYFDRAVEAVRQACLLCEKVREEWASHAALEKLDRSPVTIADFGAQAVISTLLNRAFPHIPIVAEEDSTLLREAHNRRVLEAIAAAVEKILPGLDEEELLRAIDLGRHSGGPEGMFWTLDPIDGTKGFLRGDQYAVALALIVGGQVRLGVLGCPRYPDKRGGARGWLFVADRGKGAFRIPLLEGSASPIRVSEVRDVRAAQFCESFESGHSSHEHSARIAQILEIKKPPLRMDSQAKYAAVAQGDAEIYLRLPTEASYRERIWDHAAGWLLVKEAGGEVTDVRGNVLDFSAGRTLARNVGVVATNGYLHENVLQAVNAVLD